MISETLKIRNELYARIHKGIRKALFQFSEQVGRTNPDSKEVEYLMQSASKVFELLDVHAQVEEKILLPLLHNKYSGAMVDDHWEHEMLEEEIAGLRLELSKLQTPFNLEEKLYQFYLKLNKFIGNYLLHINNEETKTAFLFIEHCSPDEIYKAVGSIAGYTTPEQKKLSLEFMALGLSGKEWSDFMKTVKRNNLKIFEQMMAQLKEHLSSDEWNNLTNALEAKEDK